MTTTQKIPERFMNVARLWQHQYALTVPLIRENVVLPHDGGDDNMYQGAKAVTWKIRDANDMSSINAEIEVKLPFKCEQRFHDPDKPTSRGFPVAAYPYDNWVDRKRQVYIFHINLVDANKSRDDTTTQGTPFAAYGFDTGNQSKRPC
jgi:hypothetical protein